jgi:hypothetical protein
MICARCNEKEASYNNLHYNWPKANMKIGTILVITEKPQCRTCFYITAHKQLVVHIRNEAYKAFNERQPVSACEEINDFAKIWLDAYLEAFEYEHQYKKRLLIREFDTRNLFRWFD